jgi:hypothetical protein
MNSFVCLFVLETGFLCIALAGLELRNWPASASRVLGFKAYASTTWLFSFIERIQYKAQNI